MTTVPSSGETSLQHIGLKPVSTPNTNTGWTFYFILFFSLIIFLSELNNIV